MEPIDPLVLKQITDSATRVAVADERNRVRVWVKSELSRRGAKGSYAKGQRVILGLLLAFMEQ